MPIALHRIHGNPLDIFFWSASVKGDPVTGTAEIIRFMIRIKGKMDRTGTFLQSGKLQSLAGSHMNMDPADQIMELRV